MIKYTRVRKVRIKREINTNTTRLKEELSTDDWDEVEKWCLEASRKEDTETKSRRERKFELLTIRKRANTFVNARFTLDRERMVKNFSSRSLTDSEEQVLALGLNFVNTLPRIPYNTIIASTEATAKQLNASEAEQLRLSMSKALHNAEIESG
jgi:hypothetical protein